MNFIPQVCSVAVSRWPSRAFVGDMERNHYLDIELHTEKLVVQQALGKATEIYPDVSPQGSVQKRPYGVSSKPAKWPGT